MSISAVVREQMTRGSWIRKMFEEGLKLKALHGPENVFDFSLGNPNTEPPPEFFAALRRVVEDERPGIHGYMQNSGFPEAREAVAQSLRSEVGLPFTKDHVVMTVGAAGALNVAFKSILDLGDEVIVIAPFFVEYNFYIHNHGGVKVVSRVGPDFLPDLVDLEAKIGPRTKALLINSPCNPSGRLIPASLLSQIGELLREKSRKYGKVIYLVSDEPYRRILFDGLEFQSPFPHYEETLMAMSHSKDLSLAGERIGFLAISPRCSHAADLFAAATFVNRTLGFINAPALMQRVLTIIGPFKTDASVYQRRRDVFLSALRQMGYDVVKPDGTFYIFPRSPIEDDIAFVRLLQSKLVLVSPGTGFDYPGYFRISTCVDDEVIERALPRFEEAIREVR